MSTTTAEMLRFDPAAHRYYIGPRELPSVTAVLKDAGIVDTRFYNDEAAARGTFVHQACHLLDEDDLDFDTLDLSLRPYVEAYQQFLNVANPIWHLIEHRVCDETHGYAGTLDRAGIINGQRMVVDIKSGSVPAFVGPQTAAYRRCLPGAHTYRRAALHLKADGSFALVELNDRHDEAVFLAALCVVQWKQRTGSWNS